MSRVTSRPISRILSRLRGGDHPSGATVTSDLGAIYPQTSDGPSVCAGCPQAALLILLREGFAEPPQSPAVLVVSYTTVSPLPSAEALGGLLSVALSRESPRVGVTHLPALWSPDFPRVGTRGRPADLSWVTVRESQGVDAASGYPSRSRLRKGHPDSTATLILLPAQPRECACRSVRGRARHVRVLPGAERCGARAP